MRGGCDALGRCPFCVIFLHPFGRCFIPTHERYLSKGINKGFLVALLLTLFCTQAGYCHPKPCLTPIVGCLERCLSLRHLYLESGEGKFLPLSNQGLGGKFYQNPHFASFHI